MTLNEGIVTLWETLGEPTDFNPYGADWVTLDTTTKGYKALQSLLNTGQTACANYKYGRGRQVRFSNLISHTKVTVKRYTLPFNIDNQDKYKITINKVDLPYPTVAELYNEGRFAGSQLEIGGDTYDVDFDSYDLITNRWEIWLTKEVPPYTVGDTLVWRKNAFLFLPKTHPWALENFIEPTELGSGIGRGNLVYILKVNDLTETQIVKKANTSEDFLFTSSDGGVATEYILLGKELKFNLSPPSGQRYGIEYYRTPTNLTLGTEEFEIPEQFHYGIVNWAAWKGFNRLHEPDMAYSYKRDWHDMMKSTKNDNDYRWERTSEGSSSIRSN